MKMKELDLDFQLLLHMVVAQIDRESLGDRLRSTALIPFMRSKNINFVVDGLKPNTRVYPFFDKVDVTKFVTPATGGVGTVTSTGGAKVSGSGLVAFVSEDVNLNNLSPV